ncbi:magnesium and cobalt transport protein CorA [Auritidibacter ignavus]|uniref:magnesium and cobalt transport protein CorA n=1 Tax=Auritidibacter ignavus TaxID=678932 RepID=UPI0015D57214|nr:magnesium and cobalt transport protein CorA [Auritidibacter ignavus]
MTYLLHSVDNVQHGASAPRLEALESIEQTFARLSSDPDARAHVVVSEPSSAEIQQCAEYFELHELAVEDTLQGHQRPKLERYDSVLFVVLHWAQYVDKTEKMKFAELHIFVGDRFFLVFADDHSLAQKVVHWLHRPFRRHVMDAGHPQTMLYFVFDGIVDGYAPIIIDLDDDLDDIEDSLFGDSATVATSQRIYELFNEIVKFLRVTRPLSHMIDLLTRGATKYGMDQEFARHLRDVRDNVTRDVEQLEGIRAALQNALTVESTLVGRKQNEDMKKVSGWAALFAVSTVIAGIYGMNFDDMPELHWSFGYLWAIGLMLTASLTLYLIFKKKGWM